MVSVILFIIDFIILILYNLFVQRDKKVERRNMNYKIVLNKDSAVSDLKEMLNNKCRIKICSDRDDNDAFRIKYAFKDKDVIQVIESLEASDFVEYRLNKNPRFPNEYLPVFKKNLTCTNIYGKEDNIELYIKLSFMKDNNLLVVVSFHEAKYSFL